MGMATNSGCGFIKLLVRLPPVCLTQRYAYGRENGQIRVEIIEAVQEGLKMYNENHAVLHINIPLHTHLHDGDKVCHELTSVLSNQSIVCEL